MSTLCEALQGEPSCPKRLCSIYLAHWVFKVPGSTRRGLTNIYFNMRDLCELH